MTPKDISDADLFFKDSRNCEQHPNIAQRKGLLLIVEVERLSAALDRIYKHSFSSEQDSSTWSDVAKEHIRIAGNALDPEGRGKAVRS
jgi:hypothetical protein